MIELEGLTKVFTGPDGHPVDAVSDVSFTVNPGEVFGLLGPNGAGKTTTLRMLCTVLKPTAGFATIAGHDIITNRRRSDTRSASCRRTPAPTTG